ncbi:MAG TPA: hypothetical protein VGQ46_08860 [Thermoanaerobaculia bacterium]|nr:hypothetical protein [Thermoanaerobaculia bacterium]
MFEGILPRSIDNTYRGQKLALWIFGLLTLMKSVIGVNSMVNGADVMSTADGIALNTYPAAAAQNLVAMWALLGLSHLVIAALGVLVLLRYRAMVPLMFGLLLLSHLGGKLILELHPIVRTGAPPASIINLTQLALIVLGLALSLWSRR